MNSSSYEAQLSVIVAAASPQKLAIEGGPPLMREAADSLSAAVLANPRDTTAVRERVIELAARALRVVRTLGEAESPPGFVNPTEARLAGMILDYAPNVANTLIADDDPVARFADEMIGAALRYADADPRTVHSSVSQRLGELFRVVGLAAHELSISP
jgi:hypothetical protein